MLATGTLASGHFGYDTIQVGVTVSCPIYGCTDSTAINYDPLANTIVGCIYPIYGCTDPSMFNYNVNANVDDGSCVPVVIGCTDPTAFNYET